MKTEVNRETRPATPAGNQPAWLQIVRERVSSLRFGTVQIVVHEGRVTQVESTQRTRLPADETAAA